MRNLRHSIALSAAAVTVVAGLTAVAPVRPALSLEPDFATIEAQENAANNKPGPRTVPGRAIPVPGTVSPQLQATIAAPYRIPAWDADPKSAAEWKDLITRLANAGAAARREAREKLGVTLEPTAIGGVKAFIRDSEGNRAREPQSLAGQRAWRRLRLWPRRGRHRRSRADGRVRRL